MSQIKFSRLVSVSSEDPKHPGSNLLKPETAGCWKCKDTGEKQAVIILQLEKLCQIRSVTICNENSAFVELLVGRSAVPDSFEVLRVASVLMSVQDAKNDCNKNVIRFFKAEEFTQTLLNQSWDRLKIICSQPFNKRVQYGLSFVKVHGNFDSTETATGSPVRDVVQTSLGKFVFKKDEKTEDKPKVGSFFARRNDIDSSTSPAVAIRAASNDPIEVLSSSSSKRLSDALLDLKGNGRKRKHQPDNLAAVNPSNDGRRSTTGPLLYVEAASDDDSEELAEKKKKEEAATVEVQNRPAGRVKRASRSSEESPKREKKSSSERSQKAKAKASTIVGKPFSRLLEDVVFVISGYQNPFRAELRSKALQMGARYKADWDTTCTHLICAFTNTPKSNQVRGSGWIVGKDWIEDCHKLRKRLKCCGYKLDKNDHFVGANDEEISEEKCEAVVRPTCPPKISSVDVPPVGENLMRGSDCQSSSVYDADTDVDTDEENLTSSLLETVALEILPDFFDKKTFYLGTDLVASIMQLLRRYIIAYKGNVLDDVDNANFIISEDSKYKQNISNVPVILPDWIWECNDQKSLIPVEHYLLK